MELFVVNRYDESKLIKENNQDQEDLILQKLQEKIEKKRKKQKKTKELIEEDAKIEKQPEIIEETPEETVVLPVEITKRKKDKRNSTSSENEDIEIDKIENEQVAINLEEPLNIEDVKKSDFVILGDDHFQKLKKVGSILPPWLSHPTVIERDLSKKSINIEDLPYLQIEITQNLRKMGFQTLFPVQETVIPWILDAHNKPAPFWPRDICISSPTGSGKTLAFAIPIVQLLMDRIAPAIRALVILPVQELAEQVATVFEKLCLGTSLKSLLLSKVRTFKIEQGKLIEKFNGKCYQKVDIVITTAGRLVEHLHSTEGFTLSSLRFLVIDEADRVMDQIQNDWLYHLNKNVKDESDEYLIGRGSGSLSQAELFEKPRQPHKLLFSATLSQDPEKLQTFKLFHPKLFATVGDAEIVVQKTGETGNLEDLEKRGKFAGKYTTPSELTEMMCITDSKTKPLTLYALIKENNYKKFLVFTNGIDGAHRLSFVLQRLFGQEMIVEEWSSELTTNDRKTVLNRFILGKVNGIICTDALARGMDIEDIDVVFSYDMPRHINTYIHRIGRTGRAGNKGTSVTLLTTTEQKKFEKILSEAGKQNIENIEIGCDIEEKYAVLYAKTLNELTQALDMENQIINKIRKGAKISNLNKGNLLGKLKNQMVGSEVNTSQIIKHLKHLPKAWTNESIQLKATDPKKQKRKKRKASVQKTEDVESEVKQPKVEENDLKIESNE